MEKIIAQKYAFAFLNIFSHQLKISDIELCQKILNFLRFNNDFFVLLQAPFITHKKRMEIFKKLFEECSNQEIFLKLINILSEKNRLFLLPAVLEALVSRYYINHGYMRFSVCSSHALTPQEVTTTVQFLTQKTGKKIIPTYITDSSLVAGLRLESFTLLWEYSIKQQLQAIKRQFVRRELSNGN